MFEFSAEKLSELYKTSFRNKNDVMQSEICGCFYCLSVFKSTQVVKYVDAGQTALCPSCSVDSVLCDKIAPINGKVLFEMYVKHFSYEEKPKKINQFMFALFLLQIVVITSVLFICKPYYSLVFVIGMLLSGLLYKFYSKIQKQIFYS